ncbi:Gfo/Idh/MocA family protein [Cellulomonas chengniuliangii]|uniref:Gfo/Idh/MocA family protein n=1 Tax=Cellulomonas chengniuliangii TaxID=2968084 RepID=UPI001D0F29ED|nr:Gfo/Idh/MocA family oxidoreductase [Cellulomonas chengniuliangii]MCC2317955.1 Gfo/Idh/MocA family oxidoreductase [Cellulomonas chengniuliangii]
MKPPTVALVGVHGHGTSHLGHARDLADQGVLRLVAVVDPRPLVDPSRGAPGARPGARLAIADPEHPIPWFPDLGALLAAGPPDVVILCTPIDTHADLAERAVRAGCDVLLEKPPTATLAELVRLVDVAQGLGRAVQVGFQTYGSHALQAVREIVDGGEIGQVRGIGAVGTWVRDEEYWARAPWAGRRTLGGRPVVDGVTTNPLAHAVATALLLGGASTVDDVQEVELDLYRANDIEADDTSSLRVTTRAGLRVALGLTLCADTHTPPRIIVHGSAGSVVLHYTRDVIEVTGSHGHRTIERGRTDLLENLLAHRANPEGTPLLAPLSATGAFMRVLEAVRNAPAPRQIAAEHVDRVHDALGARLRVRDVAQWCERVADDLRTFEELDAPWTVRA